MYKFLIALVITPALLATAGQNQISLENLEGSFQSTCFSHETEGYYRNTVAIYDRTQVEKIVKLIPPDSEINVDPNQLSDEMAYAAITWGGFSDANCTNLVAMDVIGLNEIRLGSESKTVPGAHELIIKNLETDLVEYDLIGNLTEDSFELSLDPTNTVSAPTRLGLRFTRIE